MKEEFNNYVLESDELPEETDSEASIEIISPVLKSGSFKWKGFYSKTGDSIDFFMKDKDFTKDVKSKKVSFRNGSCIDCILEIKRKLTEQGEIVNSSYNVLKVFRVRDIDGTYETPQGKKYKQELEEKKKQLSIFNQA